MQAFVIFGTADSGTPAEYFTQNPGQYLTVLRTKPKNLRSPHDAANGSTRKIFMLTGHDHPAFHK